MYLAYLLLVSQRFVFLLGILFLFISANKTVYLSIGVLHIYSFCQISFTGLNKIHFIIVIIFGVEVICKLNNLYTYARIWHGSFIYKCRIVLSRDKFVLSLKVPDYVRTVMLIESKILYSTLESDFSTRL